MNPLDQLVGIYKRGYKTTEFWVALAAGLSQALGAAFDKSQTLNHQLTNLTWVAIAYILARSGLKVAGSTAQARILAAGAAPTLNQPNATNGASSASSAAAPAPAGAGPNESIDRVRELVALRDSGSLTQGEFERAAGMVDAPADSANP